MALRVLTFNWHESYIHLLAKTGYAFDVVEKEKAGIYGWIRSIRPVPANCRLVTQAEAEAGLRAGAYDRVLAQNLGDLLFVRSFRVPKVLVFHSKLTNDIAMTARPVDRSEYLEQARRLLGQTRNLKLVFISESKRLDWEMEGEVILPGIDPGDYHGYAGDLERVVRIGNFLRERDRILGYTLQERILAGRPSTILGLHHHGTPNAIMPRDWDEYRGLLRRHRVYLHTTQAPYEDGYNLAMLECMATGMPAVSTNRAGSPVENGVNGFLCSEEAEAREGIDALLGDRSLAVSMGRRARQAVLDRFPIDRFLERWAAVLEAEPPRGKSARKAGPERLRILMSYASHPATTGAYLEKALRRHHDVITLGPSIDEQIVKAWDLEAIRGRVKAHDIPYFTEDLTEVLTVLPKGWAPDLFLFVESGITYPLNGLQSLPCLKACYLVDSHIRLEDHVEIAKEYDLVFVAQREYLPRFRAAGIERVHWLPLACDPEVHRKFETEKDFDISFVGSITRRQRRRNRLLLGLAQRFSLHVDRCFLEEMARAFSRAKIVFNASVANDLNMRVFEALATGSLLVTDEAPGSGLTDLFEDGRHLVLYRSEAELHERIRTWLGDDSAREQIAAAGRTEVLRRHTYNHRARELADVVLRALGRPIPAVPASAAQAAGASVTGRWPETHARRGEEGTVMIGNERAAKEDEAGLSEYYRKERREVAALIPEHAERILDVGCGGGHLGRLLKATARRREVWGVEADPQACREAERCLDHAALADASEWEPPVERGYFDALVFADVLEHFRDPQAVLERYLPWLKPAGAVVFSIPNVRFWGVVKHLVEGHWTYQDEGILDRGHLRFFTWNEIERLLTSCGLEVEAVHRNLDPRCPELAPGKAMDLDLGRITVRGVSAEEVMEFFVFQYLVRAVRSEACLSAEAERLERSGRHADAFELFAGLAGRGGGDARWVLKLGEMCGSASEKKRFFGLLEERLSLQPANIDLLLASARLLTEENRFEDARARLERAVLFAPQHAEARQRLCELPAA